MLLATERLVLRRFHPADLDDLWEILGDNEVMLHVEPPYSKAQTRDFLTKFCIAKNAAVACVHREQGKVIGYILFSEYRPGVYEIGWIFHKAYWGHGFAYESCQALITYAFAQLPVQKIFAETTDTVKSVPLMKKLGMRKEGIQRHHTVDSAGNWVDLHLYGLLRSDLP